MNLQLWERVLERHYSSFSQPDFQTSVCFLLESKCPWFFFFFEKFCSWTPLTQLSLMLTSTLRNSHCYSIVVVCLLCLQSDSFSVFPVFLGPWHFWRYLVKYFVEYPQFGFDSCFLMVIIRLRIWESIPHKRGTVSLHDVSMHRTFIGLTTGDVNSITCFMWSLWVYSTVRYCFFLL